VAARRVVILEPAGRLAGDLSQAARRVGLEPTVAAQPKPELLAGADLVLTAPGIAEALGPGDVPRRWVFGAADAAPRLAGAAVACGAEGVLLAPIPPEALTAAISEDGLRVETDLARARSLVATTLVDAAEDATRAALIAIAAAFGADDCIVWWRDGESMQPTAARSSPDDSYRSRVAAAARVAAASGGTVIGGGGTSVIAAPLRLAPSEVAGLIAVITDHARRFTASERSDLRALSQRVARELSHLAGHRRILAEGDRLRAGSLHDPITGTLTRGAFDQAVTNEVAAAVRRKEALTLVMLDIVGMRRINVGHGHHAGDEVLAQVAARVRAAVRGNDPVGRFGGDDLAILLIGAHHDQGYSVAEKLISRVSGSPCVVDGEELQVDVRCAVTPIAAGERSGEAAYARSTAGLRGTPPNHINVVGADLRPGDTDVVETVGLTVGTTLGGMYRVLHELSRGAMGVVYRAEDLGLGRQVAIKVLRSDLALDHELVTRFRSEAAMLASLHHKNLVQVFSLGEHAGDVYFVMELVEGQPLSEVIRAATERAEPLPTAAIEQIALEIADALDSMHSVGLFHRDIKPANILLDRERDRAVLVDVGVAARKGDRREAAGTPGYSAPESFLDAEETPATDVYGLAATVYCMLTGRPPHGAGQLASVLSRQLHEPLVPPSRLRTTLTPGVDAVLAKALDPQPRKRWASAGAFAVAMSAALDRVPERVVEARTTDDDELELPEDSQTTEKPALVRTQLDGGAAAVAAVMTPTAALSEPIAMPPPETSTGKVRGAHFRVAARVIAHRLGGAAVRGLSEASPQLAAALGPALSPLAWEPAELLVDMLERCTGGPPEDLARVIGRGTVTATFTRFFGANPTSLPVETVLRAAPAFWGRYHDWCRLTVGSASAGQAELMLDVRPMSPLLTALVSAELGRVTELAGGDRVVVTPSRADTYYRVTWA
jgi:diguanylate cyclase (GGDEF)-like protein